MQALLAFFFIVVVLILFGAFFLLIAGTSFVLRVVRLLLSPFRRRRPAQKDTVVGADGAPVIDVMVKDPACGTYLPRGDAISAKIGGETLYFCSTQCLSRYKKRP
jgi:YHS domain-containing protein